MASQKMLLLYWALWFIAGATALEYQEFRAAMYLKKYGYIQDASEMPYLVNDTILKYALKEFQTYAQLNVTGTLDSETILKMQEYRCGIKDRNLNTTKNIDSDLGVIKWRSKRISYTIAQYSSYLKDNMVDKEVMKAFNFWGQRMNIYFSQAKYGGDIEIRFVEMHPSFGAISDHVVGTSSYPGLLGKIYVKDNWLTMKELRYDIAHQIGHILGLEHESSSSIMYPMFNSENSILDDPAVAIIQKLYGVQSTVINSLCNIDSIDAIFSTANNDYTYIFKDKYYWKTFEGKMLPEHPKLISNRWSHIDGPIDAIFQDENGFTFIFIGTQFWKYIGDSLSDEYPKNISDVFPDITSKVKAFLILDDKIHIFHSDTLYIYTKNTNNVNVYELLSNVRKSYRDYEENNIIYPSFDTILYKNGELYLKFIDGTKYTDVPKDLWHQTQSDLESLEVASNSAITNIFGCVDFNNFNQKIDDNYIT